MENPQKNYKVIKKINHISSNTNNSISIIQIKNEQYILKQANSKKIAFVNMLKNEANILCRLNGHDIAPQLYYYHFGEQKNFLIISLIRGKPINKLSLGTLKIKLAVMLKIIEKVKKLHELGVVHCDLKPSNILMDLNKNIKIIDYGISVENGKNYFIDYGSVKYCSKNRLLKSKVNETDDLYSLGIIFYELIFGKLPFTGTKREIIVKKKLNLYDKVEDSNLNLIFSKIFTDTTNKYQTIQEFESDLKSLLLNISNNTIY